MIFMNFLILCPISCLPAHIFAFRSILSINLCFILSLQLSLPEGLKMGKEIMFAWRCPFVGLGRRGSDQFGECSNQFVDPFRDQFGEQFSDRFREFRGQSDEQFTDPFRVSETSLVTIQRPVQRVQRSAW